MFLFDRSFCRSVSTITDHRANGRRSNAVSMARDDPLEVVNIWFRSGSACGFWITFLFSSPLQNARF